MSDNYSFNPSEYSSESLWILLNEYQEVVQNIEGVNPEAQLVQIVNQESQAKGLTVSAMNYSTVAYRAAEELALRAKESSAVIEKIRPNVRLSPGEEELGQWSEEYKSLSELTSCISECEYLARRSSQWAVTQAFTACYEIAKKNRDMATADAINQMWFLGTLGQDPSHTPISTTNEP